MNVGEYSRGGKSRGLEAVKALDHDMNPAVKLVPGGILEVLEGKTFLFFTASVKTSDFIADGLSAWWRVRRHAHPGVKRLLLDMDNGPECGGHRSQFLNRMVQFADATGLELRLAYYPPYHSKYNPIERYWAGLEKSWGGYLLDTTEHVLARASSFAWKGVKTSVKMLSKVYEKGVRLVGEAKWKLEQRLERHSVLAWWDILIVPS